MIWLVHICVCMSENSIAPPTHPQDDMRCDLENSLRMRVRVIILLLNILFVFNLEYSTKCARKLFMSRNTGSLLPRTVFSYVHASCMMYLHKELYSSQSAPRTWTTYGSFEMVCGCRLFRARVRQRIVTESNILRRTRRDHAIYWTHPFSTSSSGTSAAFHARHHRPDRLSLTRATHVSHAKRARVESRENRTRVFRSDIYLLVDRELKA